MAQIDVDVKTLEYIFSSCDKKEAEKLLDTELSKGDAMNTELVEKLTNFLYGDYEEIKANDRVECLNEAEKIINKNNKFSLSPQKIAIIAASVAAVIILSVFILPKSENSKNANLKSMLFGDTAAVKSTKYTKESEKINEDKSVKIKSEKSIKDNDNTETVLSSELYTTEAVTDETYYDDFNNAKKHFTSLMCEDKDIVFSSFADIDYSKIKLFGVYYNTILEKECYLEIPNDQCEFSLIYNDEDLGRATINVTFEDLSITVRVFYKTENSPTLSSVYADDKGTAFSPDTATVYAIYSDNTKKRISFGDYSYTISSEEKDGYIYTFYYITYIEDDISVSTTLTYKTVKEQETEASK